MERQKIKTCLVFPPHKRLDAYYVTPPIGLLILGSILKNNENTEVEVQDHVYLLRNNELPENKNVYDACTEEILKNDPDVIGFYTQCVTYATCLNIALRIKKIKPKASIVFGGHNSAFLDVETLQEFKCVDFIVRGEGEVVFPNFIEAYVNGQDFSKIRGLTYRFGNEIRKNPDEDLIEDLDTIPLPDYSLVAPLESYKSLGETMTVLIESGRGCSYNCVFCSNCRLWKRKVRYKSVERVLEEILFYENEFKPDEYYLIHDFFSHNIKFVKAFCSKIIEMNLDIKWSCRCRLNLDSEVLHLMKEAGCQRLLYGVESGSERVLQFMNKKIKFEVVYDSIKKTIDANILPSLSFVMGLPVEDLDDVNDTLSLILRCELVGNCYPFMQLISPLPGTPLIDNYSKELEMITSTAFFDGIDYDNGSWLEEDRALINKYPEIFSTFYNIKNKNEDIKLVSEISKIYCKITEMFSFIFFYIKTIQNITELALYMEWRAWILENNLVEINKICLLKREDVWKLFIKYLNEKIKEQAFDNNKEIKALLKYQIDRYKLLSDSSFKDEQPPAEKVSREGIKDKKLYLNPHIILSAYDYNIPIIIANIRKYEIKQYEIEKSYLLLQRVSYDVQIKKIPEVLFIIISEMNNNSYKELLEFFLTNDAVKIENPTEKQFTEIVEYLIKEDIIHTMK